MKKINKITLLLIAVFLYQNTYSQTNIGVGLAYGNKISSIGINVNAQFFITDNIAVSPDFSYYFPNTASIIIGYKRKWYEANINGNYYPKLNLVDGKLKPYGLVGVNYSIISYPYYNFLTGNHEGKVSQLGANIGVGATFNIGKKILPFAQIKYTLIKSYNQAQILVGIKYEL